MNRIIILSLLLINSVGHALPLEPNIQEFARLVLDDGYSATTSEAKTGHIYPNEYAIAVLQSEGRISFRNDQERDCARRIVGNIGNIMAMTRQRPSEAQFWGNRLQGELELIRTGTCQRSPDVLHAAMTFVRDVETEIANVSERRRVAAEIQAEELREYTARAQLAETETRLRLQREAAERRAPMQQRIADAERQIAEHNVEIARLQEQEQRENEILAEQGRIAREIERAQYVEELHSGKRPIQHTDDAIIVFDAVPGFDIAARPLIQPDNKHYRLNGFIRHHDPATNRYVLSFGPDHDPKIFIVFTNADTEKLGERNARVNGLVELVGQYMANDDTPFGMSAVLLAKYIEFR